MTIDENTLQILYGSILGDGHLSCKSLRGKALFEESHSLQQKDYLQWKADKLKVFAPKIYLGEQFDKRCNKNYKKIVLYTKSSKVLAEIFPVFYSKFSLNNGLIKSNGKWINKDNVKTIFEKIGNLGLAVWFCDDGYYDYRGNVASISANDFDTEALQYIVSWFISTLGLCPKICVKNKCANLIFNVRDTKKFAETIKSYILEMPECVHYKCGTILDKNKVFAEKAKQAQKHYRERVRDNKRSYNKNYWIANKKRLASKDRQKYALNKNKILPSKKNYYKTNRQKILQQKREYYLRNRRNLLLKFKKYYDTHRHIILKKQKERYYVKILPSPTPPHPHTSPFLSKS